MAELHLASFNVNRLNTPKKQAQILHHFYRQKETPVLKYKHYTYWQLANYTHSKFCGVDIAIHKSLSHQIFNCTFDKKDRYIILDLSISVILCSPKHNFLVIFGFILYTSSGNLNNLKSPLLPVTDKFPPVIPILFMGSTKEHRLYFSWVLSEVELVTHHKYSPRANFHNLYAIWICLPTPLLFYYYPLY